MTGRFQLIEVDRSGAAGPMAGPVLAGHGQDGQHHIRVSLLDQGQQLLAVSGLAHHGDQIRP